VVSERLTANAKVANLPGFDPSILRRQMKQC
jgi:hypothetical protein